MAAPLPDLLSEDRPDFELDTILKRRLYMPQTNPKALLHHIVDCLNDLLKKAPVRFMRDEEQFEDEICQVLRRMHHLNRLNPGGNASVVLQQVNRQLVSKRMSRRGDANEVFQITPNRCTTGGPSAALTNWDPGVNCCPES
jgi:hypothetical protein